MYRLASRVSAMPIMPMPPMPMPLLFAAYYHTANVVQRGEQHWPKWRRQFGEVSALCQ